MRHVVCKVESMRPLTDKIVQLYVRLESFLSYQAGQYVEIIIQGQHVPFSIANASLGSDTLELHIRHTPSNVLIQQLLDTIKQTHQLDIVGPFGSAVYQDNDKPTILLAGGTGFAPIKAIIEQGLAAGNTTPLHLYWCARTASDLYMHQSAQAWAELMEHIRYTPLLSKPAPDWQGAGGIIYEQVAKDYPDLRQDQVYAAGPPDMVMAAWEHFQTLGLPRTAIYSDAFDFIE